MRDETYALVERRSGQTRVLAQSIIRVWHERRISFTRNYLALAVCLIATTLATAAELKEVENFLDQQATGVGVSTKSGRVFVNFPYWSDGHSISVAEIVNGQSKPFPNEEWNRPGASSGGRVAARVAFQRRDAARF